MAERVIIVGAGVAGLACALHLHRAGVEVEVLEAAARVGGRMRTDEVDGFLLDRGFQVLLTAYPECRRMLDYEALDLRAFFPGSMVWHDGRFHRLADPWQRPLSALGGVFSPIGSLADKLRVARLRRRLLATSIEEIFERPERSTLEALRAEGFSPAMIDRFFQPFLGGIFLEPQLATSSRMFEFVFKMFSTASTAVPARGMQRIPEQLAAGLPAGSITTSCRVAELDGQTLRLANGETRQARACVVATDGAAAADLLAEQRAPDWCSTTCLYYAAPRAPVEQPVLVLDGDHRGPINNLCVPSRVSPHYAPEGKDLVSVSVIGGERREQDLRSAVGAQLRRWFGAQVDHWHHLRSYSIRRALPRQAPPALQQPERPVRLRRGLYVCGDHRDNASIHGAMVSGRRAAEAILEDSTTVSGPRAA